MPILFAVYFRSCLRAHSIALNNSKTGFEMHTIKIKTTHGFSFTVEFYGCTNGAAKAASFFVTDEINKMSSLMVSAMWGQLQNYYGTEYEPTDEIRTVIYGVQHVAETEAGLFDFCEGEVDATLLSA